MAFGLVLFCNAQSNGGQRPATYVDSIRQDQKERDDLSAAMEGYHFDRTEEEPTVLDQFVRYGFWVWLLVFVGVALLMKTPSQRNWLLISATVVVGLYLITIGAAGERNASRRIAGDLGEMLAYGIGACAVYLGIDWLWSKVSKGSSKAN